LSESGSPITVVVHSQLGDGDPEGDVDVDRWQSLALGSLRTEGVVAGELNLLFIDVGSMADLNVAHMGGDGPTDVLAFPIDGEASDSDGLPVLLGDVVICPSVARSNATDHGWSVDDEIALLVVHGVLHVLGHDHAEPNEEAHMKQREQALLAAHHHP
jgi:probable rRNA maturation factor